MRAWTSALQCTEHKHFKGKNSISFCALIPLLTLPTLDKPLLSSFRVSSLLSSHFLVRFCFQFQGSIDEMTKSNSIAEFLRYQSNSHWFCLLYFPRKVWITLNCFWFFEWVGMSIFKLFLGWMVYCLRFTFVVSYKADPPFAISTPSPFHSFLKINSFDKCFHSPSKWGIVAQCIICIVETYVFRAFLDPNAILFTQSIWFFAHTGLTGIINKIMEQTDWV